MLTLKLRWVSLRQLIVGSFLVALIPIAVLMWRTQLHVGEVSASTANNIQGVSERVEQIQLLDSAGKSVVRSLRQYAVLGNETSAGLTTNAIRRAQTSLNNLCEHLSKNTHCDYLSQTLNELSKFADNTDSRWMEEYLRAFNTALDALQEDVDESIQAQLKAQQLHLAELQQQHATMTVAVVTLSLVLIVFGARFVLKPVEKLQLLIRMIAKDSGQSLPALSRSAPKELVDVEQDLHWLADRLEQLEAIRKALLRHASHELKTPLASIKEGCSLLTDGTIGQPTAGQAEVLHYLESSVDRLSLLVSKLLDYNQLLQQAKPNFEAVDLSHLVDDCVNDMALALQPHALHIDLKAVQVISDKHLLRRVLDNLLNNAIAHGSEDTPIYIESYTHNNALVLQVANCGAAIEPEQREQIFEPFVRGRAPRKDAVIGAGLGLSIVADCARLLHGKVSLSEHKHADVCFRLILPQGEAQL